MPPYNPTPTVGNYPSGLLLSGEPSYAFGSRNVNQPRVLMAITGLSADGAHATLNVVMREGFTPSVGDSATVVGTTAAGGAFNVVNQPLTAVAINAQTGIGTISYALAQTVSQVAASGAVYVKVSTVAELITNNEASQAFAIPNASGPNDNAKTIPMPVSYPATAAPSAATMALQGSV